MRPSYERWASWFVLVATVLMFADFVATFHKQHAKLDWLLVAALCALVLTLLALRIVRVTSFVRDVYTTFDVEDNPKVWSRVKTRYRYIGVSGATFLTEFRKFAEGSSQKLDGIAIQILLLYPDRELIRQSKVHELGMEVDADHQSVSLVHDVIVDTARTYASFRNAGMNIEVRFYREFCRYWAHLVDDREVYLAPLLQRQSGLKSVLLRMSGGPVRNLLIRFYFDEFDRLWSNATPVDKYFSAAKAGGTS